MPAMEGPAPDDLGIEYLRDVAPVGRGGFAYVYAATDTRFDRRVAVKVFDHFLTEDDRALFETECRTTGRLWRIPNIITFHDIEYTADGQPCIVMAYLEDGSLGDELRRHGLIPWRRAVGYMVTVLEALDAAHRHGVLHRDIKPENILLAGDEPHLTDFGLATVKTPGAGTDVGTAQVIASPLHAPPETFDGGVRDERSDVYSAASTLYNLIAGHAPFQRHADLSTEAIVERLKTQPPARLPAGLAPPELDALLQRALAKDPADRPQSAADLADALRGALDASPGPTGPGSATRSPGGPVAQRAPRSTLTQSAPIGTAAPTSVPPTATNPPAASPLAPPQPANWAPGPASGSGTPGTKPGPATSTATSGQGTAGWWIRHRQALAVGLVTTTIMASTVLINLTSRDSEPDPPSFVGALPTVAPTTPAPPSTAPSTRPPAPIALPAGSGDQWDADRARVVAEIEANGWRWNQEARTVSGPGGLLVDLATCPADWDPYQGLFADEVSLGQITPTVYNQELQDSADGFAAYLEWVSDVGGGLPASDSNGARRITVVPVKDSSIDPEAGQSTTTAFAARRLASPTVDPAAEEQQAACVPDPFVPFDGPGWTDPAGHPWAWADRISARAQGWLVGETLARSLPGRSPIRVAALVTSDDGARAGLEALQAYADRSSVSFELTVTEVGDASTEIGPAVLGMVQAPIRPDAVAVVTGSSGACGDAAVAALNAGPARLLVTTAACARSTPAVDPLAPTTWLTVGDPRLPPDDADPEGWSSWASAVLAATGYPAPQSPALLDGFASAWSMHQSMLIAEQLPGGLSRPNLLLAARALTMDNPSLADGIGYGMAGGADGDLIEGAPILRYVHADKRWEASDLGVIDLSGQVPPCAWDRVAQSCA